MCRCAGSREMRRSLVKRYSYRERDYAFGQLILTLRMQIGLTQEGLAKLLHINRRAVAGWEAGSSYPKAEHLKELITLGVRASAFADGREEEEIRALWKAAHQKVLLDESWSPTASPSSPRPRPPHSPPRWSSASRSCSRACRPAAACWCSTTSRPCWRVVTARVNTSHLSQKEEKQDKKAPNLAYCQKAKRK